MKIRTQWAAGALTLALLGAPLAGMAASSNSPPTHSSGMKTMHATQKMSGYRNWSTTQMTNLQKALAAKGFKVSATGMWNGETRAAVKAFQKKSHLNPTGYPNAKTRKALGLDW